jgi:signal transduction histidine kinase
MDKTAEKERMNEIIDTIMKVSRGDYSVQVDLSDEMDEVDSLAMGLNMMIDDLKTGTVGLGYASNRVEDIISTIQRVARGDYTSACKLSGESDIFDALGIGINMMVDDIRNGIEELRQANEELQASEEELRAANEELRATEEELRASNEELQAANDELRETQEQLVRSEKLAAIGQLAGGVGHELRNPLGAIKNAVYYIKGKIANSELAQKEPRLMEFLNIMDDEVNSSNKIISDLLGFSRMNKPAVSPTRIEKVIENALSQSPVPENIELIKRLDSNLPEIEIDPDQIKQVLVNTIINAVQAMPNGGKLTINSSRKDKLLEIEIADTGGGIPDETIGKIFDPLFTTKAKGIGLGLAVCKSIVDRHGGHIEVKSKVGKGTSFNIKLPLKVV